MRAHLPRVDAVLVQAVIAAALSFAHLHDVALAAGQEGWKAWVYPISVDLLLVAAWRRLRTDTAKVAGWCWFLIALAASLGANVATAGLLDLDDVPDWLRILVAGWPAVAFLGGTLLAHSTTDGADNSDEASEREQAPQAEKPVDEESAPEPPPAPAPEPEATSVPAPESAMPNVPAALVEHARQVADDHRTRTGTDIDTPTLRARLGVPTPLAEAIATRI